MHGMGHSCAAMTLKEKQKTFTLWPYLKSMTIMVVFSDMNEPDSLFLLIGVSVR